MKHICKTCKFWRRDLIFSAVSNGACTESEKVRMTNPNDACRFWRPRLPQARPPTKSQKVRKW